MRSLRIALFIGGLLLSFIVACAENALSYSADWTLMSLTTEQLAVTDPQQVWNSENSGIAANTETGKYTEATNSGRGMQVAPQNVSTMSVFGKPAKHHHSGDHHTQNVWRDRWAAVPFSAMGK